MVQLARYQTLSKHSSTVAGYSLDKVLGQEGAVLTYDEDARGITETDHMSGGLVDSVIYNGASGGAVIARNIDLENKKANFGKQNYLIGVIKGPEYKEYQSSNGHSGTGTVIFVKHAHYIDEATDAVIKYNSKPYNLKESISKEANSKVALD